MPDQIENPNEFDALEPVSVKQQLQAELDALILEEKELDLIIKRQTVTKIKADLAAKLDENRQRQLATKNFLAQREFAQDRCNHHKGGKDAIAVMHGQGEDHNYCVAKHRLPNSKFLVLCMRCGKEWHPASFLGDVPATPGYEEALRFPTDNTASGSTTFLFQRV